MHISLNNYPTNPYPVRDLPILRAFGSQTPVTGPASSGLTLTMTRLCVLTIEFLLPYLPYINDKLFH